MATINSLTTVTPSRAALLAEFYLTRKTPCMLWGGAGIGKSSLVYQIARKLGNWPVKEFRAGQHEPVDLTGIPFANMHDMVTQWLIPEFLPNVERDGEYGILFLDEILQGSVMMQGALFQLFLDRKLGNYTLPSGWIIVAASNRLSDKAGIQKMLAPLANRMAHLDVVFDLESWLAWAALPESNVPMIARDFMRFREGLFAADMPANARNFLTPRSYTEACKYADAPDALRLPLMAGLIGDAAAIEFEGFIRVASKLPSKTSIIADPDGAMLPSAGEVGMNYALACAIGRWAERHNFGRLLQYAARMPKEFEILAATDAAKRNASLRETAAFTKWAVANQDVTL